MIAGGPQPQYPDGTFAWAVDAHHVGGCLQTYATTYVRAETAEGACEAGDQMLRVKLRGSSRRWVPSARPARTGELGMVPLEQTA